MPAKSIGEIQTDARAYAEKNFSTVDYHLPEDPELFKHVAGIIIQQIMTAYATGYYAGVEDQRKRK